MAHVRHMAARAHHPTPEPPGPRIIMKRCERDESRQCEDHQPVMRGDAVRNGLEMAPVIVMCHES